MKKYIQTDQTTDNIKIFSKRTTLERSFQKLFEFLNQIYWIKTHLLPPQGFPAPLGSQQGAVMTPIMYIVNINDFHIFHGI